MTRGTSYIVAILVAALFLVQPVIGCAVALTAQHSDHSCCQKTSAQSPQPNQCCSATSATTEPVKITADRTPLWTVSPDTVQLLVAPVSSEATSVTLDECSQPGLYTLFHQLLI
ncbi:MAG: hypothetical protein IT168_11315 [Bryobacterales bacterium]|nr:hypothetical protein [Bryobacterales bacterium]